MDWIKEGDFKLRVKKIPGDGNCLFAALMDQIICNKIPVYEGANQRELRHLIANHIEANQEKYTPQILGNLMDMGSMLEGDAQNEEVLKYIAKLREVGFWGGGEVIAATSNLMRAGVLVFQEGGSPLKFLPDGTCALYAIKIYYRDSSGKRGTRDHYDSVIEYNFAHTPRRIENTYETGKSRHESRGEVGQNTHKDKLMKNKEFRAFNWYPARIITHDNPYTLIEDDKDAPLTPPHLNKGSKRIKIATWNVRGCSREEKRKLIEEVLEEEGIHVTAIQESHLTTGAVKSSKYSWFLSGGDNEGKTRRGVAFVVREGMGIRVMNFHPYSENLAMINIDTQSIKVNLVTCHIPDSRAKGKNKEMVKLSQMIAKLTKHKMPLIVLGDFNAHIGKTEVPVDNRLVGPNLRHARSNKNGEELLNLILLHRLNVRTSWGDCKSVLTTWSNGTQESQIDHVLCTNYSTNKIWCKAKWISGVQTDHKLVQASVMPEAKQTSGAHALHTPPKRKFWNINRLKGKKESSEYKNEVSKGLKIAKMRTEKEEGSDAGNGCWDETCSIIRDAAAKTLSTPTSPMTPRRRRAIANQQKARFQKQSNQDLPGLREKLRTANEQRLIATKLHETEKCSAFFQNISNTNPKERVRETFKFIKKYRRSKLGKRHFIPMMKWEAMLQDGGSNIKCALIPETDGLKPADPPSVGEIARIIKSFKKGTAPGIDQINIELLQEGTQELIVELTKTIGKAWSENIVPESWTYTIQVPIPKSKNPKQPEDYRRISLCSVAYKVYAKVLLESLNAILKPVPQYQAAFLTNRSTDDHIFTTNRIFEERWREGLVTYAMALDLAKAFDTVDHSALVIILKHQGAPHFLINRIIKACILEKTAIQWFGQYTKFYDKTKGVKQGCPISPYLFLRVLHEVITTTVETLAQFCIKDRKGISLPVILAYADDITVITENLEDLEELIREITPNLLSTGMQLNLNKCEIMIRDPLETQEDDRQSIILNNIPIRRVQSLKYLGSQIPDKLNRKVTTKGRVQKATNGARLLLPFIQKYNPPWKTIKIMYNTMIAPIALYGLKGTAMTKENRIALRRMENHILSLMVQYCQEIPSRSIRTLLEGKTIDKRVINTRIKYWAHIQRRPEDSLLQVAEKLKARKKKVGRPCITWPDTLQKEMRETGIPLEQWIDSAQTKEETKELTEKIYSIHEEEEDSLDEIVPQDTG